MINILLLGTDESRMYLPPSQDSVASSGFGEQINASENVNDNPNGYGEVKLVQDAHENNQSEYASYYGVPTKINDTQNDNLTGGSYDVSALGVPGISPSGKTTSYNNLTPSGTAYFGQQLNTKL